MLLAGSLPSTAFAADTNTPPPRTVVVQTHSLNSYCRYYDGQWQGCMVATDGNCYFGASTHSDRHGAGFFRFDPRTKELAVLAEDISLVCGENPTNQVPQGKLHSPIVEANGWLYLSTHLGLYTEEGKRNYTGAHILGYELATGKLRDYGVLRPHYTVYSAIAVDPERRWLYAFVMPFREEDVRTDGSHLYRLDLRTGRAHDLGVVKRGGTEYNGSYWFFVDRHGDCWFTFGHENGALFRARAGSGKIDRWNNVLPKNRIGHYSEMSMRQAERHWTWAAALPGRARCLFTMGIYEWQREVNRSVFYGDEFLWQFDPAKPIQQSEAFARIAYLGPNFLGVALGGDRVYCIQPALGDDHDAAVAPKRPTRSWTRRGSPLYLRSLPLDADPKALPTDHGMLVDQDGRRALSLEALAADNAGRIFMVGDWTILPNEQPLLRFHERTRTYREEKRGMFFGVAEAESQAP